MKRYSATIWENDQPRQFAEVLAALSDTATLQNFLRDVLTEKEITEISARLEAAKMLQVGAKYTDIIAETKLSSRTIARISDWLQNGAGGYSPALEILAHHAHTSPARA